MKIIYSVKLSNGSFQIFYFKFCPIWLELDRTEREESNMQRYNCPVGQEELKPAAGPGLCVRGGAGRKEGGAAAGGHRQGKALQTNPPGPGIC